MIVLFDSPEAMPCTEPGPRVVENTTFLQLPGSWMGNALHAYPIPLTSTNTVKLNEFLAKLKHFRGHMAAKQLWAYAPRNDSGRFKGYAVLYCGSAVQRTGFLELPKQRWSGATS